MRKIVFILCFLFLLVLSNLFLVSAECSKAPTVTNYFSYIQECDNQLTLHFKDQNIQTLQSIHVASTNLPFIIDNGGVVSNCEKREKQGRTLSGRTLPIFVGYCQGTKLADLANAYETSGFNPLPNIANSLKKFNQFLMENDGDFNIQESIVLDSKGKPYKGKVKYPFLISGYENKKWIGGIIDNNYNEPESYQVAGVEITFLSKKESSISFTDFNSYFMRERTSGLEKYHKGTFEVVAKYNSDKNTLQCTSGYFVDETERQLKDLKFAFIGNLETFYCCPTADFFGPEICVMRPLIDENYYSSLSYAPQCDFSIERIFFESKEIKSENIQVTYSTNPQEIKSLIS